MKIKTFRVCNSVRTLGASGIGLILARTLSVRNVTVVVLDIQGLDDLENCINSFLLLSAFLKKRTCSR